MREVGGEAKKGPEQYQRRRTGRRSGSGKSPKRSRTSSAMPAATCRREADGDGHRPAAALRDTSNQNRLRIQGTKEEQKYVLRGEVTECSDDAAH